MTPTPPRPRADAWQALQDPEGQLQRAAQALGLTLNTTQSKRLISYLALLLRWNKVYNLTALRSPAEAFSHHLVDCLAALPPLQRHLATAAQEAGEQSNTPPPVQLLDVGSGGGLPGIVFAIMHPEWKTDCVDTVGKKAGFIRQAALELKLPNLRGLHARVEDLTPPASGYAVITCRAFASLAQFTALTPHLLAPAGCWMAMKAQASPDELAALPPSVKVFHVEQLQVPGLDAQRSLVWMRPEANTP